MALLSIDGVSVAYGKTEVVHAVSLAVEEGQTVTVIGPNGAGKTTLLSAAIGLLPYTGRITYAGHDLARLDVEDRVALGLCLVPEQRELFGDMSVGDNLLLGAYGRRAAGAEIRRGLDEIFVRFPRLRERRRQTASTLSGGERQMLALGRALMSRPKLLLLDEPSLGLAPIVVREIFSILAALRASGVSILLVEQNAEITLAICDYAYLMKRGEIVAQGTGAELRADSGVLEAYLS